MLVVEDESLIRMLLADAFDDAGFIVLEAGGADEAVSIFGARQDIAVVVTDLRMPGTMDGLGLAGWMCEHAPSIPIIITSGVAAPTDAAANPCVVHIVSKPYNPSDVVDLAADLIPSADDNVYRRGAKEPVVSLPPPTE
ncbi:MAG: response regulator [Caulobacteraceae bacterium]|nr:response regulator [Caulobacteraceae bacterium]